VERGSGEDIVTEVFSGTLKKKKFNVPGNGINPV
jgi:hypothetical protein